MILVLKILALVNVALMFLPLLKFRGTKYFSYFIVLAVLDPIFILLYIFFKIKSFYYMPLVVSLQLLALPVKESKYVVLAAISTILVIPHLNGYGFLAPVITVTISALIVYYFIGQILHEYKHSCEIPLFLPVLIFCTIVNSFKMSLYYSNLQFLTKYYIWFSIFGLITTLLLFYFGAARKLKLKLPVVHHKDHSEEKNEKSESIEMPHIYTIDFHDPFKQLTSREKHVLLLIGEGYKASEIAEKMFVSRNAVYFHSKNIKSKLNIKTTAML